LHLHDPKYEEAIPLISNLEEAEDIIELGTKYEHHPIRSYVQRTRHDQTVWSIYFFACALLKHLLWEGIDFEFSFQIFFSIFQIFNELFLKFFRVVSK